MSAASQTNFLDTRNSVSAVAPDPSSSVTISPAVRGGRAAVSVTDQTGEARYPSFKGIMAAKKKPLETWSLSDLGVEAEKVGLSVAWSQVEETTERPPRSAGEIVTDEDGSGATALAEFLASKKFI